MNTCIRKPIPFYAGLALFLAGCVLTYLLFTQLDKKAAERRAKAEAQASVSCEVTSTRIGGFEYVKPLLFVEQNCESPNLRYVKDALSQEIDRLKKAGDIISASVYVRVFDHGEWTGVNVDKNYHPCSIL